VLSDSTWHCPLSTYASGSNRNMNMTDWRVVAVVAAFLLALVLVLTGNAALLPDLAREVRP
jgi:hypothetical protein